MKCSKIVRKPEIKLSSKSRKSVSTEEQRKFYKIHKLQGIHQHTFFREFSVLTMTSIEILVHLVNAFFTLRLLKPLDKLTKRNE